MGGDVLGLADLADVGLVDLLLVVEREQVRDGDLLDAVAEALGEQILLEEVLGRLVEPTMARRFLRRRRSDGLLFDGGEVLGYWWLLLKMSW